MRLLGFAHGAQVPATTIDGVGFFTIFWRIILPLSVPIIVVTVIWQITQIWNDFLFGVSFSAGGSQPITVALNNIVNSSTGVKEYNLDMAAAIIAGLPTLLVYVFVGRSRTDCRICEELVKWHLLKYAIWQNSSARR
jgi:glucose/mannose transport system permease protein